MALPVNRPSNEVVIPVPYADMSAPGSAFGAATHKGYISRVYSVITAALTGTNATWHVEVNGVDICPNPTVTVTQAGSAAGDVDVLEVGQSPASWVNEGDTIEFVCGGESSTTSITNFYAVIEVH